MPHFTVVSPPINWGVEPAPVIMAGILLAVYVRRWTTVRRSGDHKGAPVWRLASWIAGCLTLVIAQGNPIDELGEYLLVMHMTQHLLLLDIFPLLILFGLNRVLMRSLNTTILGVLPVIAILVVGQFLGAETLLDFAVALLVGMVLGAYSSIFIAAPALAWLKEREPRHKAVRERIERNERSGGDKRASAMPVSIDEYVPANAGRVAASTERESGTTVTAPRSAPTGAIPPRPRKKKRR